MNQVSAICHGIMQPEHVPDRRVVGTQHRMGGTSFAELANTARGPLPLKGCAEPRVGYGP